MLFRVTRTIAEDADIELDIDIDSEDWANEVINYLDNLSPAEAKNINWALIDINYEIDTADEDE